ncbi:hypothetical protein GGR51DRAFT_564027 [Nemania sp. FL0031]|nr:hypothetical protein GGR51DRAFT_564027 [Nemania sp. FL0031]
MISSSDNSAETAQSTPELPSEAWLEQEKSWIARFFNERVPEELRNPNCKRLRKFCSASPPSPGYRAGYESSDSGASAYAPKFPKGAFPLRRQLTTVTELAQFVAKSAFWPQPVSTYSPTSWTKTARSNLVRLTQNDSLRKIEPRFANKASSLLENFSLLDKLPPVLTHHDFAEVNIMVDLQGHVTGVIDFDDAQTEAFGMCIFGVYEGFFGVMRDQKWSFFDEPAGDGSGRSVRNVLDTAFWDTLWESVPPGMNRQEFEEAVMVAVDIGSVNRYFVRGLIENVNLESEDHRLSLEFARGIFLEW